MTETESYQDAPSEVHEKGQDLSLNIDLASPLLRCQFELVANYDWHASDGEADCDYDEDGKDLCGQEIHVSYSAVKAVTARSA